MGTQEYLTSTTGLEPPELCKMSCDGIAESQGREIKQLLMILAKNSEFEMCIHIFRNIIATFTKTNVLFMQTITFNSRQTLYFLAKVFRIFNRLGKLLTFRFW